MRVLPFIPYFLECGDLDEVFDIIIIGGGPAGLTAATYARRSGKNVLVIEKNAFGGQITWSPRVENFPTVISASGAELGDRMLEQAMEQGAEVELEEVVSLEKEDNIFSVKCESGKVFKALSVIAATGAKPRMLNIEHEDKLVGNGVCFCAVCDGAFYKGRSVAVNGGGNSALQDALLLSEKCEKVYLIHRRDSFRGEAALVEALQKKENVEFLMNASINSLIGENELTGIKITQNGIDREISVDGLFVAIGHQPQNGIFAPFISLTDSGYADSDESCLTDTDGLFVAGDCRKKSVRQLTTAVADGAVAALAACAYLG